RPPCCLSRVREPEIRRPRQPLQHGDTKRLTTRIMATRKANNTEPSACAQKPWLRHYDYWVPAEANFPRQPIYQVLNLAATQFADRPATAFFGAQLTFGELKWQADKLATALARMGIGKGDRVGVMLPNCPQYVISFFAIT